VTHIAVILLLSVILSQFISNVPLVALYLPLLVNHQLSDSHLLALAVGSTIAGNFSILGAASNVIIIQNAEKRGIKDIGFFKFIAIGAPLTIINILIYAYFL
jgi:Na+/H+ antiporter NhaD/arsenite permease-like protein